MWKMKGRSMAAAPNTEQKAISLGLAFFYFIDIHKEV
jgi:hypothetical protein